jgi:hypothetical protein
MHAQRLRIAARPLGSERSIASRPRAPLSSTACGAAADRHATHLRHIDESDPAPPLLVSAEDDLWLGWTATQLWPRWCPSGQLHLPAQSYDRLVGRSCQTLYPPSQGPALCHFPLEVVPAGPSSHRWRSENQPYRLHHKATYYKRSLPNLRRPNLSFAAHECPQAVRRPAGKVDERKLVKSNAIVTSLQHKIPSNAI